MIIPNMMKPFLLAILACTALRAAAVDSLWLLKPARVFDGEAIHQNWWVAVQDNRIVYAGSAAQFPADTYKGWVVRPMDLPGKTLLPGLIEGHAHLLLHPYNEVSWNQQVLEESRAERVIRAANHARATLLAGFTSVRDLGTEGAAYDDIGLKASIEKGIIPGPRLLVATRAIVATGSYGPKSPAAEVDYPKGAAEADGVEGLTREIRTQIGKGADLIKLYADYRWGPNGEARPTFTQAELNTAVEVAASAGRPVVVHAVTAEAMQRAARAGVNSIEHGDQGDEATFRLMKEKGVAYCPTLAATASVQQYRGWKKGLEPEPPALVNKRQSFAAALKAGVTICMGGDVGVFAHGNNALEMEMMVDYGMPAMAVLKSATSVNADVFGLSDRLGRIRPGLLADLLVVDGNPVEDISRIRAVSAVMKDGKWVK